MPERINVGEKYGEPPLVALGAATVVLTGLAAFLSYRGWHSAVWVGFAVAAGVGFLFRLCHVARNRRWLTATEGGFVLEDRHGATELADADVTAVGTRTTLRYAGGRPRGVVRAGRVEVRRDGGDTSGFDVRYEHPLRRDDPLGAFWERLIVGLADRAAGGALAGDGWHLDADGLAFRDRLGDVVLPPDDIAAAAVVDGKVCVWAAGEPLPWFRTPEGSTNALVLARVLERLLRDRDPADGDPDDGLGRLMFERRTSVSPFTVTIVVVILGGVFALAGLARGGADGMSALMALYTTVTFPILLFFWYNRRNAFRCHARGVARVSGRRVRELPFEDVGSFTYAATRHYYNTVYTGTSVRMSFVPRDRSAKAIHYSATVYNADDELDKLRDRASGLIAARLHRELRAGTPVPWTDRVRFLPDGLELTSRTGLFRRKAVRVIAYGDVVETDIREGYFHLFERGEKLSVYVTPVSVKNFFPGIALLDRILAAGSPLECGETVTAGAVG